MTVSMTMTRTRVLAALSLLAVGTTAAVAQPPPNGPRRDRARTFLVLRIADALNLSDEKALQVSGIIRKADEERRDLRSQRQGIEKQVRDALEHSPRDATELGKLIGQANELDERLATVPERSLREVQKILTVEEQAKLVLFRPELQDQIRDAVRRRLDPPDDRFGGRRGRQFGRPLGGPPE